MVVIGAVVAVVEEVVAEVPEAEVPPVEEVAGGAEEVAEEA